MAESEFYQKKHHTVAIWVAVLILILILLLSFAWLAPMLFGVTESGVNTIPLFYDGDRVIVKDGVLQYISAEERPGVITRDDKVQWEINTAVDLFENEYVGPDGSITVQSDNGDKVIAPGTSHDYTFSLKNTGNISMDYIMELDSIFSLQNHDLPVRVRLSTGDKWVIGGEEAWENPDELEKIVERGTLDVGHTVEYIFEWQWPFESGVEEEKLLNNLNDVIIANTAVTQEVNFLLQIKTTSEVTPDCIPTDPDGKPIMVPLYLWNVLLIGVLPLLLLGCGIILLLFWRRPIYVTGYVAGFAPALVGAELAFGRKKDELRSDCRFLFKKIYTGKHTVTLGETEFVIRLKRKRKIEGVVFEEKDDVLVLMVPSNIRALELYLLHAADSLNVRRDWWALIDKKRNVVTPAGVTEPDENKCNRTPGGLTVNEKDALDIPVEPSAK